MDGTVQLNLLTVFLEEPGFEELDWLSASLSSPCSPLNPMEGPGSPVGIFAKSIYHKNTRPNNKLTQCGSQKALQRDHWVQA